MRNVSRIKDVPKTPALYALYGGRARNAWVAYVGIAGDLRQRLVQHFERRDSSIVTGVSAVGLNIDAVAYVHWWEADHFDDRTNLRASEVAAFDLLDPALRSRGGVTQDAEDLAGRRAFARKIEKLIEAGPTGRYTPTTLADLEDRLVQLERRIAQLEDGPPR